MKYKLTNDQILHVINKVGEDVIIDVPAVDGVKVRRQTCEQIKLAIDVILDREDKHVRLRKSIWKVIEAVADDKNPYTAGAPWEEDNATPR